MIELPADAGAGLGLFQDLHGSADPDAFARRLRDASERHRGHAAPLFLEHLVADRRPPWRWCARPWRAGSLSTSSAVQPARYRGWPAGSP